MKRPPDRGLIIVRGEGQRVFIHDEGDIWMSVKVIQTGKKVSLLFAADKDVADIDREEVFEAKYGDS